MQKIWTDSLRCKHTNICYLFHGTDHKTIFNGIITNGFNRIFNSRYAYGNGVYFARDASYSITYCTKEKKRTRYNYQYMLYCRVIIGDYCIGSSLKKIPDYKNNKNIQYESMVDRLNNPSIFVTTNDHQAYPLALITIKTY